MLSFVVILDIWEKKLSQNNEFCSFFFNTKLSENESEDEGINRAAKLVFSQHLKQL